MRLGSAEKLDSGEEHWYVPPSEMKKERKNLTLVVLAAGIGSRYGGIKQMEPVGPSGEFIVDYSVYDAIRAGFDKVVFVIRRDIEAAFKATIGARIAERVATEYLFQELSTSLPSGVRVPDDRKKPWGTAHAVLTCASAVKGPFAVINADDFYGRSSYPILARFLAHTARSKSGYCMVGFILKNTLSGHGQVSRGVCGTARTGLLKSIVETHAIEKNGNRIRCAGGILSGNELVSMNLWGFKPSIFDHLERGFGAFLETEGGNPRAEFLIPAVVNELVHERRATVRVFRTKAAWLGMTNPEDKDRVAAGISRLVKRGVYPAKLWK